jgi:hypothetical protein
MPGGPMMQPAPGAMQPAGGAGPVGKTRNPLVCGLLTFITCGMYYPIAMMFWAGDLKAYLGNDPEITPWFGLIFPLNLMLLLKLPDKVVEAKRRAGHPNPSSAGFIMYFLLGWYFIPKDLNEIWNPGGQHS